MDKAKKLNCHRCGNWSGSYFIEMGGAPFYHIHLCETCAVKENESEEEEDEF